jgi:hypothetical protein
VPVSTRRVEVRPRRDGGRRTRFPSASQDTHGGSHRVRQDVRSEKAVTDSVDALEAVSGTASATPSGAQLRRFAALTLSHFSNFAS